MKTLTQPRGGPRAVLLHQVFGGLEGAGGIGGSIVVGLDRENRVVLVRADVVRSPHLATRSRLRAVDALRAVSGAALKVAGSRGEWIEFAGGSFPAPSFARPVAFPLGDAGARPAFEVDFTRRLDDRTRTIVDAVTGEVLYRSSLVWGEAPEGRVFRNYPGAPKGGQHELVSFAGDPIASPNGWFSAIRGVELPTTNGNNADTAAHWGLLPAVIAPEGLGQIRPVGVSGVFDFAFPDAWAKSECGKLPIEGGFPDAPTYALDTLPAIVNLFYHHNLMHDFWYRLGFDELAGAMQVSNFGKTGAGRENDPLIGMAQAGALGGDGPFGLSLGRDNAYMATSADGLPSWSAMFLYEPLPAVFEALCRDGDLDTGIIYHEYAHAPTNRWVGGEIGNLNGYHGGSMGEGWADFFAAHYIHLVGLGSNTNTANYTTGNLKRGDRNWEMADVTAGFADLAFGLRGAEVHDDGEIWSGTMWAIRSALERARPNGAQLAGQLMADAMPISGPSPTMLDMRDAILAADVARTRGANQALLWQEFAHRGFGKSASAVDDNDSDPIPAYDHADPQRNGVIEGRVV
ncbi:MAG: M36 family metallopeptidase, partial [Actinomycetota bacterium]